MNPATRLPMSDVTFLGYCEIHCGTERRLFSRAQIDRLCALSGQVPVVWRAQDALWLPLGPEIILPAVQAARQRLPPPPPRSQTVEQENEPDACSTLRFGIRTVA